MTTISITAEASAAIEAAFPGDWRNEIRLDGKGGYLLTLPEGMIALLEAIRAQVSPIPTLSSESRRDRLARADSDQVVS
jgi:hypothetical protein